MCSPPARRTSTTLSASPSRIADARAPIDSPNLCDVLSSAIFVLSRPSTRSANTAPASTDANWSGSPTRINRASGRTASNSRAIIVSDTIDVSSTTITSCGSRLPRLWRNLAEVSGLLPSSRCSVIACNPANACRSDGASLPTSSWTASCRRAAALPVGAASAIRKWVPLVSKANSLATVVVLPVPGPPVSTVNPCDSATSAAARCSSNPAGNRRSISGDACLGLAPIIVSTSRHTCCSSSQYRSRYSRSPSTRSTGGCPASGLARTASSHWSTSGHGRPSTPTCCSTDRTSRHTDPLRSARTTNATASATASSGSDARAVSR